MAESQKTPPATTPQQAQSTLDEQDSQTSNQVFSTDISTDSQGRTWQVGAMPNFGDATVRLDDPKLKQVDSERLEVIAANQPERVRQWLLALRRALNIQKILIPQQKLASVPLMGSSEQNLETADTYFYLALTTRDGPNLALLYFLEVVLLTFELAKAIAKQTRGRDQFAGFYAEFATTSLENWLEEVATTPPAGEYIDERFDQVAIQKVINVLEESLVVLDELTTLKSEQKNEEAEPEETARQELSAARAAVIASKMGEKQAEPLLSVGETTAEGSAPAQPTEQIEDAQAEQPTAGVPKLKLTAPQDVLQVVLDRKFVRRSQELAGERTTVRQFTHESAWVMQGVLAQLYPDYIGRMNELPPEVIAAVSESVIASVASASASDSFGQITSRMRAIREAANEALRQTVVLEQLAQQQGQSLPISKKPGIVTTPDGTTNSFPTRADLVTANLDDVTAYLASSLQAQGLPSKSTSELETLAFEQLSLLSTDTLISLAMGVPVAREKTFKQMAQSAVGQVAGQAATEQALKEQVAAKLTLMIADGLEQGLSPEQVLAEIEALPDEALEALTGLEISADTRDQVRSSITAIALNQFNTAFSVAVVGPREQADSAQALKHYATFAAASKTPEGEQIQAGQVKHQQNTSAHAKVSAFLRQYQQTWNALSQEQQVAACLLLDEPIPNKLFEANPPVDLRPYMPIGVMDLLDVLGTQEFDNLAAAYAKDPTRFKNVASRSQAISEVFTLQIPDSDFRQLFQELARLDYLERLDRFDALSQDAQAKLAQMYRFASIAELRAAWANSYQEGQTGSANGLILLTTVAVVAPAIEQVPELVGDQIIIDPLQTSELTADLLDSQSDGEIGDAFDRAGYGENDRAGTALPRGVRGKIRNSRKMVNGAFARAKKSATKRLSGSLTKKALSEGAKQLIGKGMAGFTAGLSYVATNKKLRNAAIIATTALVSAAINGAGTIAGLVLGGLGSAAGFLLGGPIGAAAGGVGGAIVGGAIDAPWNVRLWGGPQYPLGGTPSEVPMSSYKGTSATVNSDQAGAASTTTSSLSPAAAVTTGIIVAKSVASSVLAVAIMPALAFGGIAALTLVVLMVIWGAFLIPTPNTPNQRLTPGQIEENPYITIRKRANPNKIPNDTATEITYTITIEPKTGYAVKINSVTDTFQAVGETPPTNLISPLASDAFGSDILTTTAAQQYSLVMGGVDAYVTNRIQVNFDAYDGVTQQMLIKSNQTAGASAYVIIGNPKIGCWPTSGQIYQLEEGYSGSGYSHSPLHADAIDIAGTNADPTIYSPFPGEACAYEERTGSQYTGYGKYVKVSTSIFGPNLVLVFAHLSRFVDLSPNQCRQVVPGDIIGIMGSTGNSTGTHLHYELLKANNPGFRLRELIIDGQNIHLYQNVQSCFSPG